MNWKKLAASLALPLAVGAVAALLSSPMAGFAAMNPPPLTPPPWVFPVVWTTLYLLMGYCAYRIQTASADPAQIRQALNSYLLQLGINFLWPLVFFRLQWYLGALVLLAALWYCVFLTLRRFSAIDETAGNLLLPYILWVTFALYLNFGVYLLN